MLRSDFQEVRRFRRAANERFESAEILHANARRTDAVYLAGYGVECMLKALLLSHAPESQHAETLTSFHGQHGHNLPALADQIRRLGVSVPKGVQRYLNRVSTTWSTDLRYEPGRLGERNAREFLNAAAVVIRWLDGGSTNG